MSATFLKRLESEMKKRGFSRASLSKAAGMNPTGIRDMIQRGSSPRIDTAMELASALGVSVGYLLGEVNNSDTSLHTEGFRLIDVYDIRASAGPGAIVVETSRTEPMYQLAFRERWLEKITSARDEDLAVLFTDGDSMEPTLRDGDTMLVDKSQTNIRRPGIYVIGFEGTLNVKRISVNELDRTIVISSDNPTYTSYTARPDDDFQVLGRVIWVGRKV